MQQRGFSLVELSIVLVILGLLVGGILAGQSLIQASELRSVGNDYQKYMTAVSTFRDKYFAIPGDMANATNFWGTAAVSSCDTVNSLTLANPHNTCDGDGNGNVILGESFRFWHHLSNAGLVEGQYIGISDGPSGDTVTIRNSPVSRYNNGLWWVDSHNTIYPAMWDITYGNFFQFGALVPNDNNYNGIMSIPDAWNLDTKIDDGKPATGRLVTSGWSPWTTASSNTDLNATYRMTNANKCTLKFIRLF